jgi:hypothetical protein
VAIVVGIKALPEDRTGWNDPLIVNIDQRTVQLPVKRLERLPDEKKLFNELKPFHSVLYSETMKCKYLRKSTAEESMATANAMNAFQRYTSRLIESNLHCLIGQTDVDPLLVEKIVKQTAKSSQAFLREMLSTQQFSVYVFNMNQDLNEHSSKVEEFTQKLDNLVQISEIERSEILAQTRPLERNIEELDAFLLLLQEFREKLATTEKPTFLSAGRRPSAHKRNKSWFS